MLPVKDEIQMDPQEEFNYLQDLFGIGSLIDNPESLNAPQFDLNALVPTADEDGTKRKRPRPDFSSDAPDLDSSMPSITHPSTPYTPITNMRTNPFSFVFHQKYI